MTQNTTREHPEFSLAFQLKPTKAEPDRDNASGGRPIASESLPINSLIIFSSLTRSQVGLADRVEAMWSVTKLFWGLRTGKSLRTWEGVFDTDTVFTRWLAHSTFVDPVPPKPSIVIITFQASARCVLCCHIGCVVFIHFNNHGVMQSDSSVVLLSCTFIERVGVLSVQTCKWWRKQRFCIHFSDIGSTVTDRFQWMERGVTTNLAEENLCRSLSWETRIVQATKEHHAVWKGSAHWSVSSGKHFRPSKSRKQRSLCREKNLVGVQGGMRLNVQQFSFKFFMSIIPFTSHWNTTSSHHQPFEWTRTTLTPQSFKWETFSTSNDFRTPQACASVCCGSIRHLFGWLTLTMTSMDILSCWVAFGCRKYLSCWVAVIVWILHSTALFKASNKTQGQGVSVLSVQLVVSFPVCVCQFVKEGIVLGEVRVARVLIANFRAFSSWSTQSATPPTGFAPWCPVGLKWNAKAHCDMSVVRFALHTTFSPWLVQWWLLNTSTLQLAPKSGKLWHDTSFVLATTRFREAKTTSDAFKKKKNTDFFVLCACRRRSWHSGKSTPALPQSDIFWGRRGGGVPTPSTSETCHVCKLCKIKLNSNMEHSFVLVMAASLAPQNGAIGGTAHRASARPRMRRRCWLVRSLATRIRWSMTRNNCYTETRVDAVQKSIANLEPAWPRRLRSAGKSIPTSSLHFIALALNDRSVEEMVSLLIEDYDKKSYCVRGWSRPMLRRRCRLIFLWHRLTETLNRFFFFLKKKKSATTGCWARASPQTCKR